MAANDMRMIVELGSEAQNHDAFLAGTVVDLKRT
jgi:hypothetical protein